MIERIIELSIRNRFLVLILAAGLTVAGIYATLNTPIDAIPDLSENQVIVFTDWMGRSPKEIEDQITPPRWAKSSGTQSRRAPPIPSILESSGRLTNSTLRRSSIRHSAWRMWRSSAALLWSIRSMSGPKS
jgi:hypothetical protein